MLRYKKIQINDELQGNLFVWFEKYIAALATRML